MSIIAAACRCGEATVSPGFAAKVTLRRAGRGRSVSFLYSCGRTIIRSVFCEKASQQDALFAGNKVLLSEQRERRISLAALAGFLSAGFLYSCGRIEARSNFRSELCSARRAARYGLWRGSLVVILGGQPWRTSRSAHSALRRSLRRMSQCYVQLGRVQR